MLELLAGLSKVATLSTSLQPALHPADAAEERLTRLRSHTETVDEQSTPRRARHFSEDLGAKKFKGLTAIACHPRIGTEGRMKDASHPDGTIAKNNFVTVSKTVVIYGSSGLPAQVLQVAKVESLSLCLLQRQGEAGILGGAFSGLLGSQ